MNITKSIKFVRYSMRVYDKVKKNVSTLAVDYFKSTTLKEIKEDLANNGFEFLEIIEADCFTRKYSMDANKFIKNATEGIEKFNEKNVTEIKNRKKESKIWLQSTKQAEKCQK